MGLAKLQSSERLGISAEGREFPILAHRVSAHPRAVPCCLLLTPHSNARFALPLKMEGRFWRCKKRELVHWKPFFQSQIENVTPSCYVSSSSHLHLSGKLYAG